MNSEINQHAINNIVEAMNDDSLIVFVGAGVSANSGLPSWNQLIGKLRTELSLLDEDEEDNLKVAQFYYDTWGKQKYFQKISGIFDEYVNADPNAIHDHIFRIQPRHLITTNYDTILEDKMNIGIDKYNIIKRDADIPYTNANRYLIKMHGDLAARNIVLKENDYLDYEDNFYMVSTLIKSLIMNSTILFVGYSLGDSTFNSIFRLIHNNFGDNTKKAYFYTPNKPKYPVAEYYKKKGIHVLSSEKKKVPSNEMGKLTSEFLSKISNAKNFKATNYNELWEELKFLDKLTFLESRNVTSFTNLEDKAHLYYPDQYKWEKSDKGNFNLPENSEISNFLSKKTMINNFLGVDILHPNKIEINKILQPAFDLYTEKKYSEAKVKFREIANESYKKKDYINFLLAEFNVSHINPAMFEEELPLAETVYDDELTKVLDRIIDSSQKDVKKIAIFFRDNILNFNFVYKKIYIINDLLDKLKLERFSYKKGGFSSNSNLSILKYEFQSFINFINLNCICVHQYKEYKLVVNRYFESLLVALDNSNYSKNKDGLSLGTSSIIEAIEIDDVTTIVPYINTKMLPVYLDNYSLIKMKVTDEAFNFIVEEIIELCEKSNNRMSSDYALLNQYINFLFVIEIKDCNQLIDLLEKYPVFYSNKTETRKILIMLLNNSEKLTEKSYKKLLGIINKKVEIIITNTFELHFENYRYYAILLKKAKESIHDVSISISSFKDRLLIIDNVPNRVNEIERYQLVLSSFYDYLEEEVKELVNDILKKYSNLSEDKIKRSFVVSMIESNIYKFDNLKDAIFSEVINEIKSHNNNSIILFPDPLEIVILDLFKLYQYGYFKKEQIMESSISEKIKGEIPEVDWLLFDIRDSETIERLMKNRTFYELKKTFSKSSDDEKLLNDWAIKQFENNAVQLSKK